MFGTDLRCSDDATLVQGLTKIASEIRHIVKSGNAALVNPALQLLGAKRLAPPLRHELSERGCVHSQQIGAFNDSRHDIQVGKRFTNVPVLTAVNVAFWEEEGNFNSSGFRSVGAVNSVGVNAVREIRADGAGVGLLGIGSAHQFAILGDGVVTFQDLHEHGTGDHEINQILEEGTLFVHGIETLGIAARKLHQAGSHDRQTGLLEAGDDLANYILGDCIGLDDGKGAFNSHLSSVTV